MSIQAIREIIEDNVLPKQVDYITFEVDEWTIHIYFHEPDLNQHEIAQMLNEAKRFDLGNAYSAVEHPPHGGQGMHHIHAYHRNNQLFALNIDGSAHDRSHGYTIPNKVADAIKVKFPEWIIPPKNLIESAHLDFVWALYARLNG